MQIVRRRETCSIAVIMTEDVCSGFLIVAAFCSALSVPASAHNGRHFPSLRTRGWVRCVVSLWTHPDIGHGNLLCDRRSSSRASTIPKDLKVRSAFSRKAAAFRRAFYNADRDDTRNHGGIQNLRQFRLAMNSGACGWCLKVQRGTAKHSHESRRRRLGLGSSAWCFFLAFLAMRFSVVSRHIAEAKSMREGRPCRPEASPQV